MLMYLANNTRPDIAHAVHAFARYSHIPKQTHATTVKYILRYLKGTVVFWIKIHSQLSLDHDM